MSPMGGARRTRTFTLHLTTAGRELLVVVLVCAFFGAQAPGLVRTLAALGAALLGLATLLAAANVRGIVAGRAHPVRGTVGARLGLVLPLHSRARVLAPRALRLALGEAPLEAAPLAGEVGQLAAEPTPVALLFRPRRRGRTEHLWLTVRGGDPFGLAQATRTLEVTVDVLALPRRGRLARSSSPGRRDVPAHAGRPERGEEELDHVRDWRPGESLHRMHWRLSARRGRPILREPRAPAVGALELHLSTTVAGRTLSASRRTAFERAVTLAATLAEQHLRAGRSLILSIEGGAREVGLHGRAGLARVLTRLALVEGHAEAAAKSRLEPAQSSSPPKPLDAHARAGELVVVRAGGGMGRAPVGRATHVFDVDAPLGHAHHVPWLAVWRRA